MAEGPTRPFRAALAADHDAGHLAVIAEIKRRSPSKGDLAVDLVAGSVAESYAEGGASALSVLTDVDFFGGSPADLAEARGACPLPVLRKDFTVVEADVFDARAMGADAVLLIAAVLDDHELADFRGLGAELGLDVLVECHDEAEVERALEAGADLVGVNRRDLVTFEVDTARAVRARPRDPLRRGPGGRVRRHAGPTTPAAWPTPATTPSWWGRRWSPRATGPRPWPPSAPPAPLPEATHPTELVRVLVVGTTVLPTSSEGAGRWSGFSSWGRRSPRTSSEGGNGCVGRTGASRSIEPCS